MRRSHRRILSIGAVSVAVMAMAVGATAGDENRRLRTEADVIAAEREAALYEASTPEARFEAAVGDGSPLATPAALTAAIDAADSSRLESLVLVGAMRETEEQYLGFEQMSYGDGTGTLMVYWQYMPENMDLAPVVGEFGVTARDEALTIVTDSRDLVGTTLRIVRVYDGTKILSVEANNIDGVEISELIEFAKDVFAGLPG